MSSAYHPRSVRVEARDGRWAVVDGTSGTEQVYRTADTRPEAERLARLRKGVVKAAVTRRHNKRWAERDAAAAAAGVTWGWLVSGLSVEEAEAWLGLA